MVVHGRVWVGSLVPSRPALCGSDADAGAAIAHYPITRPRTHARSGSTPLRQSHVGIGPAHRRAWGDCSKAPPSWQNLLGLEHRSGWRRRGTNVARQFTAIQLRDVFGGKGNPVGRVTERRQKACSHGRRTRRGRNPPSAGSPGLAHHRSNELFRTHHWIIEGPGYCGGISLANGQQDGTGGSGTFPPAPPQAARPSRSARKRTAVLRTRIPQARAAQSLNGPTGKPCGSFPTRLPSDPQDGAKTGARSVIRVFGTRRPTFATPGLCPVAVPACGLSLNIFRWLAWAARFSGSGRGLTAEGFVAIRSVLGGTMLSPPGAGARGSETDGVLEFLGRADPRQGEAARLRIEPGRIEAALFSRRPTTQ